MERLDYRKIAPEPIRMLGELSNYSRQCGLEERLIELVKLRASQINGCANCVQLHANNLRKLGESEARLQLVVVWREASGFSAREQAALDWAEAVTLVASSHVPDAVFEAAKQAFSDKELVDLTVALVTINAHNRLAVAFRRVPAS
jgi:AhpD family alkylhydroperoxidase